MIDPDNFRTLVSRTEDRGREYDISHPSRSIWALEDIAEQLAGIHDALIRLEALLRAARWERP